MLTVVIIKRRVDHTHTHTQVLLGPHGKAKVSES